MENCAVVLFIKFKQALTLMEDGKIISNILTG